MIVLMVPVKETHAYVRLRALLPRAAQVPRDVHPRRGPGRAEGLAGALPGRYPAQRAHSPGSVEGL